MNIEEKPEIFRLGESGENWIELIIAELLEGKGGKEYGEREKQLRWLYRQLSEHLEEERITLLIDGLRKLEGGNEGAFLRVNRFVATGTALVGPESEIISLADDKTIPEATQNLVFKQLLKELSSYLGEKERLGKESLQNPIPPGSEREERSRWAGVLTRSLFFFVIGRGGEAPLAAQAREELTKLTESESPYLIQGAVHNLIDLYFGKQCEQSEIKELARKAKASGNQAIKWAFVSEFGRSVQSERFYTPEGIELAAAITRLAEGDERLFPLVLLHINQKMNRREKAHERAKKEFPPEEYPFLHQLLDTSDPNKIRELLLQKGKSEAEGVED